MRKVIKRDGRAVEFDDAKIRKVFYKILKSVNKDDKKLIDELIGNIKRKLTLKEILTVELIQDTIEETLLENALFKEYRSMVVYREKHKENRDIISFLKPVPMIDSYINKDSWEIKENSNMAFSIQGLNNFVTKKVAKSYWLNKIYSDKIKEAHRNGDLHIHDLDFLGAYCVGWDLRDLLIRGFGGVEGKIESKPAKHFSSILGQMVNFIYTLQGEAAGAQAFSNVDTYLAPFIYYDCLSYKEVKQNMQEFIYNMNVPTRVGFQSPFSNITLDLQIPEFMENEAVIRDGRFTNKKYGDFQKEMYMFDKAFFEVTSEGDAKGRPFTFPIPTINIDKKFDWNNPNYAPLWEATGKYGLPYFSNFINSDMNPADARSMCKLPSTEIIYRDAKGNIAKGEIRNIVNNFIERKNRIDVLVNGEFKPVKDVIALKLEDKEILKITLNNGIIDKMTLDHPSLVIENGELVEKESRYLKRGDEFPFAKYPYKGELGDFDLGRLVGLYAGDGWISHEGATFNIVFNKKDFSFISPLIKMAKERFVAVPSIYYNDEHHYIKLSIASRGLVGIIKEYVRGDNALNKRLNSKLFGRSIDFRKGFLIGMIESDGSVLKDRNQIVLHLGNKELIQDNFLLARSLGINTTYFESKNRTGDVEKTAYTLNFSAGNPEWFVNYFGLRKGRNLKYKEYKDFYGVKIVKVEREKYTGYVYDFEMDSKEHSFQLANGIITHNCCRLRIDNRELQKRGGGLFGANPLTGSIGVVTINLPRIGYISHSKEEFFNKLENLMEIARDSLIEKRKVVERLTEKGLFPYSRVYLKSVKERFDKYWKNHFSTIGLIGLNEASINLINAGLGSKKGRAFGIETLDFMRKVLRRFQEETGDVFNLEATPAEGTSYSLALKDREYFGDGKLKFQGSKDNIYYTNSSQLPVHFTDDIFEELDLQDELLTKYTGGCVEHLFLGESITDYRNVKNLIKKVFTNYKLPYLSLTPTFSICPIHGFIQGKHFECPICKKERLDKIDKKIDNLRRYIDD